jgi:hypothetical protein
MFLLQAGKIFYFDDKLILATSTLLATISNMAATEVPPLL